MFDKFLTEVLKLAPWQMHGVELQKKYLKKAFTADSAKKAITAILVVFELIGLTVFDNPIRPLGDELDLTGYTLVFEDEFEGDALDTTVWDYRGLGARRGGFNAESQVKLEDGKMIMTGEYLEDGTYGEGWYTGMLKLKERYCKGYFEIRCILNEGSGFWSAFWLQADAPYTASISKGGIGGAEIDIMESYNNESHKRYESIGQTIHCAGVNGVQEGYQSERLGYYTGNNIHQEYNTYGLMWTDDEYIFYINGVETCRSSFGDGVSEVAEDVIVSLEIPDETQLAPLDKASYKTEYIVDYVRIYQPILTTVK